MPRDNLPEGATRCLNDNCLFDIGHEAVLGAAELESRHLDTITTSGGSLLQSEKHVVRLRAFSAVTHGIRERSEPE